MASRPSRCGPGCLCLCGLCVPWGLLEGMSLSAVLLLSRAVTCCPSVHPWGRGRVWRGWNPGRVVPSGRQAPPPAPPVQTRAGLRWPHGSCVLGLGLSCLGLPGLHSRLPCLSCDVLHVPMMLHSRIASSELPAWFCLCPHLTRV